MTSPNENPLTPGSLAASGVQGIIRKPSVTQNDHSSSDHVNVDPVPRRLPQLPDCPKWESCSAPICPIDPNWGARRHRPGERICRWLLELAKSEGSTVLAGALSVETASTVAEVSPDIIARHSDIRAKLRYAAGQGSRTVAAGKLNALRCAKVCPHG